MSSSLSSIQYETATLNCADIGLGAAGLVEGECIETETFFSPLAPPTKMKEHFFPKNSIYIRKEMCEVFQELTKSGREMSQIVIGSPGVGKSVLIFLVALYRVPCPVRGEACLLHSQDEGCWRVHERVFYEEEGQQRQRE